MEITFQIKSGIIYLEQRGLSDIEAYLQCFREIVQAPDYVVGMPVIADVAGLLDSLSVKDRMRLRDELARGELRKFRPRRYANVTSVPMADMLAKLTVDIFRGSNDATYATIDMSVFQTVAEAEAWVRSG